MKKILIIISLFSCLFARAQTVNRFRDSTWQKGNFRIDSKLLYITEGAGNLKVLTSDDYGRATWQTFSSAGVTQGALDDSISDVRAIRKVDTIYKNLDSIVFKINGLRYSIKDSTGTAGATVSSYGKNTGKDSTILVLSDGTRYSAKDSIANLTGYALQVSLNDTANVLRGLIPSVSSYATITNLKDSTALLRGLIPNVSGSSLSGLTAATAINNIFNTNYKQRWNWNTIAGDTALVIASNSTGAASNLQNLLTVSQSGANATSSQTTYSAIFSNTKTGTTSTNIAGRFKAVGATNNYAIEADNLIKIVNSSTGVRGLTFWSSSGENARIGCGYNNSGFDNVEINNLATSGNTAIVFKTKNTECARFTGSSGYLHLGTVANATYPLHINGNSNGVSMYCDNRILCDASSQYGFTAQNAGGLANFGAVSGSNIAVISTASTPQIYVTSTNTGIGTTSTPDASAKLELSSTTSGFLPPRMTATQASAISSPAKGLMLYVTNTNGTFTSAGWWGYGTSWKLILAE